MLARSAKGSQECTRLVSREEIEKKKCQGEEAKGQGYKRECARRGKARHGNERQQESCSPRNGNEIHTTATQHRISEEKTRNTAAQKPKGGNEPVLYMNILIIGYCPPPPPPTAIGGIGTTGVLTRLFGKLTLPQFAPVEGALP